MAPDNRVRISVQYRGQKCFFVRMESDRNVLLVDFESIHSAALLPRGDAVARCRILCGLGYDAHVITQSGIQLYDDVTQPPTLKAPEQDRIPMHVGDVLIVPGQPPRNGYYVRFPQTAFESLWGETADAAYQKLVEHPLAAELIPLAEKFVAPPEPIVTPEQVQAALQRERYGNRRIRPGDRE
jgi:hypothetical protein